MRSKLKREIFHHPKILLTMRILHTADLHLGQILYQSYDRSDEHQHFFHQLTKWCTEYQPNALLVSGDVFDMQQPSASTKKAFTDYFAQLHLSCPEMHIIITAGNHDSASRIQADSAVWQFANTHLIGVSPALDAPNGWQDNYIIKLSQGYVIALPFMVGERKEQLQSLLDRVAAENSDDKPVVVMGHAAVSGLDASGHGFEVGKLKTVDMEALGKGYDYFALGHIHKPQTIGHQEDAFEKTISYPTPVVRYSGSALHVSCDETYPHSVSLVDIDKHEGTVTIRQLVIDELRHFHVLPQDGSSLTSEKSAIAAIQELAYQGKECYFRLQLDRKTFLSENFNQMVYDVLDKNGNHLRYNPKHTWTGVSDEPDSESQPLVFEVAELQQMTDPIAFIEKTQNQYPDLDLEEVRKAFDEIRFEVARIEDEALQKELKKTKNKVKTNEPNKNKSGL